MFHTLLDTDVRDDIAGRRHTLNADYPHRISFLLLAVNAMLRDRRLAELARSLHRASERLWLRVTNPGYYQIAEADIQALQKANTDLNRAITKLKMKTRK
jgi:hypothetical protein